MSQRPAKSSLMLSPFASSPQFLYPPPPPLHSLGKAMDLFALEAAGIEEGSLIRGSSTQDPGDSRAASHIEVKMASKEGLVGRSPAYTLGSSGGAVASVHARFRA